jgi:hypothetical protein
VNEKPRRAVDHYALSLFLCGYDRLLTRADRLAWAFLLALTQ